MLNQGHPDDERLSALAAGDTEATGDATLRAHVTSCDRCAGVVSELGVLRAALSELPDVAPHRPLRLLPPVEADEPSTADRLGVWARRLFAPALTAGAALAMVGVIGTAAPSIGGQAASGGGPGGGADSAATDSLTLEAAGSFAPAAANSETDDRAASGEGGATTLDLEDEASRDDFAGEATDGDAAFVERSPWPMVLFAGVALMIGAALLRWILVPRSG